MKLAVIADDLTGANATGVKLSKQGISTATIVRGLPLPEEDYDALCLDTDSRYEQPQVAKKRISEAMAFIHKKHSPSVYCKRIDSTLRGNIGAELDMMLDTLGAESIAIVVPAFPESGRITIGNFSLVEGVPLQETDVAKDPISPLRSSKVTEIIASQTDKTISACGINEVLQGNEALQMCLQNKVKEGVRIIVVDAVTDEQIDRIAEVMSKLEQTVVAVDPGPLSASYAKTATGQVTMKKKILATVGSVTSLTGQQLDYFIKKWRIDPVYVNADRLATYSEHWQEEIDTVVKKAASKIKNDSMILVTTYHPGQPLLDLKRRARKEDVSEEALAKRITDGLAAISREIIQQNEGSIGGCFLSGGDLTSSVCAVARAQGIELIDEVLPLAAYGRFIGGYLQNIPVVTKGGMVGDKQSLNKCIHYLLTKMSNNLNNKERISYEQTS
ncbi:four-carbon acid sugar kinase family protein [Tuberibacillus sp. Marseille-P3662]|uniref:four-carbon acid sugar kinase family protein n=1 Tax=Tuberibacillus sp. Marseille-P3662 TaxID=1965358 RepID=UPI000A1C88FA|nr:four-carbon acid sugar kinase family protein [Tuberibacillus sp. Marseille-P3662]